MKHIKRFLPALALVVIACGGAAALNLAQKSSASVHRNVPAQAAFEPSIVNRLSVPPGFAVSVFASGLEHPRMMEVGTDGTVYVTRRDKGDVLALRDHDGDGRAEDVQVFATGLPGVHGIASRGAELYLASSTTVWKTPVAAAAPQVVVDGLPDGGQHPNRMLRFGPDDRMYVSVGSSCNNCAEANQLERATLMRYAADGTQREVIAKGLRNTIGYDWHPQTQSLWGMDHGSDFRGDEIPPEELNRIEVGANYGWPLCYADRTVDTMSNVKPEDLALEPGVREPSRQPMSREDYCAQTQPSVLTTQAHSAPMAMRFYTQAQFPSEYRNDAFVAMRGSWNRGNPVGYKVVRLRFDAGGQPTGIEDFLTGFLAEDGGTFYGRPVGVAIAADGALLVSDDTLGAIYRIAYRSP